MGIGIQIALKTMAGLFSSGTLEQIRAASDIVDAIGSNLPLKRAGASFVALCPFHKEKSPVSMSIRTANLSPLRLPQGRRRVRFRQGIREH